MGLNNRNLSHLMNQNKYLIVTPLLMVLAILSFSSPLHRLLGEENYAVTHLILATLVIIVSGTIAIQTFMFFHHTLSLHRSVLGSIFFSVTLLEICHAITYKGMPFFFVESSSYYSTWFYILNRLMLAIAILYVVLTKDRSVPKQFIWIAYGVAFVYSIAWIALVYSPNRLFPELVIDGVGVTTLSTSLQLLAAFIQVVAIVFIIRNRRIRRPFYNTVFLASFYLLMSDVFYSLYSSAYDIYNFIGHLLQVFASYALLKGLYHSSVAEPFLRQKQAERELKKNEKFLHTITTNMGEGLVVCNHDGRVTFMNEEAERMFWWTKEEDARKNFFQYLYKPNEKTQCMQSEFMLNQAEKRKVDEARFYRQDGTEVLVSYTVTPYVEDGEQTGSIIVFKDITEQKKNKELIRYLAYHDDLTGLPNRRKFNEQLDEWIAQQPSDSLAVLLVGIDRFKYINDALGHQFGDSLLVEFGKRLREMLDDKLFIARLRGDVFTILLASKETEEAIREITQQIESGFTTPLKVQDLLFTVSVNFGIAIYPQHGKDSEELVKNANIALIQAHEQDETLFMYHASMANEFRERLELESDLHQALANDELFLVYQPQINSQTKKVMAMEALLRWEHPVRGLISPGVFIPIAEQSKLILQIGEWVLREASQQLKRWHEEGHTDMRISVNLSARQLYQDDLSDIILNILQENELLPSFLQLEVTESMTMINIQQSVKILKKLKELGVRISIDDFGTGYSSLSYLRHLSFDQLKIDKSFIRDFVENEDSYAIVSMIVSMAHHLNMEVIAEGVETLQQLEKLLEINCTKIQGFLFQQPITPEEFSIQYEEFETKIKRILTEDVQMA